MKTKAEERFVLPVMVGLVVGWEQFVGNRSGYIAGITWAASAVPGFPSGRLGRDKSLRAHKVEPSKDEGAEPTGKKSPSSEVRTVSD